MAPDQWRKRKLSKLCADLGLGSVYYVALDREKEESVRKQVSRCPSGTYQGWHNGFECWAVSTWSVTRVPHILEWEHQVASQGTWHTFSPAGELDPENPRLAAMLSMFNYQETNQAQENYKVLELAAIALEGEKCLPPDQRDSRFFQGLEIAKHEAKIVRNDGHFLTYLEGKGVMKETLHTMNYEDATILRTALNLGLVHETAFALTWDTFFADHELQKKVGGSLGPCYPWQIQDAGTSSGHQAKKHRKKKKVKKKQTEKVVEGSEGLAEDNRADINVKDTVLTPSLGNQSALHGNESTKHALSLGSSTTETAESQTTEELYADAQVGETQLRISNPAISIVEDSQEKPQSANSTIQPSEKAAASLLPSTTTKEDQLQYTVKSQAALNPIDHSKFQVKSDRSSEGEATPGNDSETSEAQKHEHTTSLSQMVKDHSTPQTVSSKRSASKRNRKKSKESRVPERSLVGEDTTKGEPAMQDISSGAFSETSEPFLDCNPQLTTRDGRSPISSSCATNVKKGNPSVATSSPGGKDTWAQVAAAFKPPVRHANSERNPAISQSTSSSSSTSGANLSNLPAFDLNQFPMLGSSLISARAKLLPDRPANIDTGISHKAPSSVDDDYLQLSRESQGESAQNPNQSPAVVQSLVACEQPVGEVTANIKTTEDQSLSDQQVSTGESVSSLISQGRHLRDPKSAGQIDPNDLNETGLSEAKNQLSSSPSPQSLEEVRDARREQQAHAKRTRERSISIIRRATERRRARSQTPSSQASSEAPNSPAGELSFCSETIAEDSLEYEDSAGSTTFHEHLPTHVEDSVSPTQSIVDEISTHSSLSPVNPTNRESFENYETGRSMLSTQPPLIRPPQTTKSQHSSSIRETGMHTRQLMGSSKLGLGIHETQFDQATPRASRSSTPIPGADQRVVNTLEISNPVSRLQDDKSTNIEQAPKDQYLFEHENVTVCYPTEEAIMMLRVRLIRNRAKSTTRLDELMTAHRMHQEATRLTKKYNKIRRPGYDELDPSSLLASECSPRREDYTYAPWTAETPWRYLAADESIETFTFPTHVKAFRNPPTMRPSKNEPKVREALSGHHDAPVVVMRHDSGTEAPSVNFEPSINAFMIWPAKTPQFELRGNETHPDYLPPRKLCEYQAVEMLDYDVWRADRSTFSCMLPSCHQSVSDHDTTTVICLGCGPHTQIRYCSRKHQLQDLSQHWSECGLPGYMINVHFHVDKDSFPLRYQKAAPSICDIHGLETYPKSLQRLHSLWNGGFYTLFHQTKKKHLINFPNPAAILIGPRAPTSFPFPSSPTAATLTAAHLGPRLERLLNLAFIDSSVQTTLMRYLYQLLRLGLRQQFGIKHANALESFLLPQFKAEFDFDATKCGLVEPVPDDRTNPTYRRHCRYPPKRPATFHLLHNQTPIPPSDPCECTWAGDAAVESSFGRICNKSCLTHRRRLDAKVGILFRGPGLQKHVERVEASSWLLRVWHRQHPSVRDWRERQVGVGFPGTRKERFEGMVPVRGRGWDGWACWGEFGGWSEDIWRSQSRS